MLKTSLKSLFVLFLVTISLEHSCHAQQGRFTVMTYNIENFFDIMHDVYKDGKGGVIEKDDYAYLPLAVKQGPMKEVISRECSKIDNFYYKRECFNKDWNAETYTVKLKNILFGIGYNNGCGADIIMLQEIENIRVLKDIYNNLPQKCGYRSFGLLEGPDTRGIDIGFISRFQAVKHTLIDYPRQPGDKARRSHYLATFNVGGEAVSVIGNHWPSLGTPDPKVRVIAAQMLKDAVNKLSSNLIIAVGDFNTSIHKEPVVFNEVYKTFVEASQFNVKPNMPGSHYYQGNWDFLDHILVAKKSLDPSTAKFRPIWESFFVVNEGLTWPHDQKDNKGKVKYKKGTPKRFSDYYKEGFSDHLPIVMTFEKF